MTTNQYKSMMQKRLALPLNKVVEDRLNAALAVIGLTSNEFACLNGSRSFWITAQRRLVIWMILGEPFVRGNSRHYQVPLTDAAVACGLINHSTISTAAREMEPYPAKSMECKEVDEIVRLFDEALEGNEITPIDAQEMMRAYNKLRGW